MAEHGTLCLDAIENLDLSLQTDLVRLLETGLWRKYGERKPRRGDVRLIVGTCYNLARGVENDWFRPDLFERLSTATITLPPAEPEDIPWLGRRFFGDPGNRAGFRPIALAPDTIPVLFDEWPETFRDLKGVVEVVGLAISEGGIKVPAWHFLAALTKEEWLQALEVSGRRRVAKMFPPKGVPASDAAPADKPRSPRMRGYFEKLVRRFARA